MNNIKSDVNTRTLNKFNVVILCYDFPPLSSSGSHRPYSWFKYFHKANIFTTVITRQWSEKIEFPEDRYNSNFSNIKITNTENGQIISLPHKKSLKEKIILNKGMNRYTLLRKSITFFEEILKFWTPYLDDKYYLFKYTEKYLLKHKPDILLITGEPFVLFKYGHVLSKKHSIPWFADYRDGWSSNHSKSLGLLNKLYSSYQEYLEKTYLSNAIGFSSVSNQLVKQIEKLIPKKGITIANGADLNLINSIAHNELIENQNFNILYTGILYDGMKIDPYLEGFENFIKKNPQANIKTTFIGITLNHTKWLKTIQNLMKKYPNNFVIINRLPHEACIKQQKSATILLNFILGAQSEGVIGAKTYELISIRKPILVVPCNKETNPPLFPDKNIQTFVYSAKEVEDYLTYYFNLFITNKDLKTNLSDKELFEISREKQAIKLGNHLKSSIN